MTMIFIIYKSHCLYLSKAENTKNELNRSAKRLNSFRSQVTSFCVQLGSLYKIVALTGPYRTSLNVMQVCVFIYACMYVRMCLCMYLRSQICIQIYVCMFVVVYLSLMDWNVMERKRVSLLNGFLTLFYYRSIQLCYTGSHPPFILSTPKLSKSLHTMFL